MDLTNRGKTYVLIALLSFLFSFFIITNNYFPFLGLSISLLGFTVFSYNLKRSKNTHTKLYFAFTLIFAILLAIRSQMDVTFLNLLSALFFGTLMLVNNDKKVKGFFDNILAPAVLIFKSVLTSSEYYFERTKKSSGVNKTKIGNTLFGILVSVVLLIIVVPLLSSANPLFAKMVENISDFLNLQNIFNYFGFENIFLWCVRLVFFFGFLYIIPKIVTLINKTESFTLPISFNLDTYLLTIPKFVLATVLFIFFVFQYQFYFANQEYLSLMGLSNSEHTREVFAQLSIVAGITIILLYNDRKTLSDTKTLNWILGIQGLFLTLMAYKSVFDYITAWGLTYARLYGLTFATWITGIFVLYFLSYEIKKPTGDFVKNTIIFSGVILILINLANFDYLIYHFKKSATGQGIDYTYLARLSPDSLSYYDQLDKLEKATEFKKYNTNEYHNQNPLLLLYNIEYLQRKYSKIDFRTFNILEYKQYLEVKNIDTQKLRSIYENYLPPLD